MEQRLSESRPQSQEPPALALSPVPGPESGAEVDPNPQSPAPTEELYAHYKALVARAVEVFGDEFVANRWLTSRQPDLENRSPLEIAQAAGFRSAELDQMLGRLEHGVFA